MLFSRRALRFGTDFAGPRKMLNRLFDNWVYGGFLAGLLLLALVNYSPLIRRST